jgi:hypothetical protein
VEVKFDPDHDVVEMGEPSKAKVKKRVAKG